MYNNNMDTLILIYFSLFIGNSNFTGHPVFPLASLLCIIMYYLTLFKGYFHILIV